MDYKIEKNIPVPPRGMRYPFDEMEIGDSFAFPLSGLKRVSSAAHKYGLAHDKTYCLRRLQDGSRCWRVK